MAKTDLGVVPLMGAGQVHPCRQHPREHAKGEVPIDIPDRRTLACSVGIVLRLLLSLVAVYFVRVLPEHTVWEQSALATAGPASSAGVIVLRSYFPPPFGSVQPMKGLTPAIAVVWAAATAVGLFVPRHADRAALTLFTFLAATSLVPPLARKPEKQRDDSR